jgi:hypothetical protein
MFAAEYLKFKQACEADDPLLVDLVFKRIRRILEEAALLVSDTVQPDSFIWRLWHYIERHNRKSNLDVEKVFLNGLYFNNDTVFLGLHTWSTQLSICKEFVNRC